MDSFRHRLVILLVIRTIMKRTMEPVGLIWEPLEDQALTTI